MMDLEKIKAIRERNRLAMVQEAAEREAQKQREAEREKELESARKVAAERHHSDMVKLVDLVTSCPGRPLPRNTVNRLKEIRLRHQILATVEALERHGHR
jgi:hypothetical protein